MDKNKIQKLECKTPPTKLINKLDDIQKQIDTGDIKVWSEYKPKRKSIWKRLLP